MNDNIRQLNPFRWKVDRLACNRMVDIVTSYIGLPGSFTRFGKHRERDRVPTRRERPSDYD